MSNVEYKRALCFASHANCGVLATVEDGKIVSVSSRCQGGYEDLGDLSVYPGIIDIHNHGFGGWSMTDPCEEKDIRGYAKALTTVCVTSL